MLCRYYSIFTSYCQIGMHKNIILHKRSVFLTIGHIEKLLCRLYNNKKRRTMFI